MSDLLPSGKLLSPNQVGYFPVVFTPIDGWATPTNLQGIAYKGQVNTITIQYVPLLLTGMVVRSSDLAYRFLVQGAPGRRYHVEACTDLVHWTLIGLVTNETRTARFLDFVPRPPKRFYRVLEDTNYQFVAP